MDEWIRMHGFETHFARVVNELLLSLACLPLFAPSSVWSRAAGIHGSTVSFAKALTALAEGGMILVSPPVESVLDGALDQLSSSMKGAERLNVPRLVHMGALVFEVGG